MAHMTTVKCKQCKKEFEARTADVNRGWGKFCSKSCKAKKQEKRTGQYANYLHRGVRTRDGIVMGPNDHGLSDQNYEQIMDDLEQGWDAHKDTF